MELFCDEMILIYSVNSSTKRAKLPVKQHMVMQIKQVIRRRTLKDFGAQKHEKTIPRTLKLMDHRIKTFSKHIYKYTTEGRLFQS